MNPKTSVRRDALSQLHPLHTVIVSTALIVSTWLLMKGLSLPLIYTQKMVFWNSSYSVCEGVVALWKSNEVLLAVVLFFFSIVFPIVKLAALAIIWFMALPEAQRVRLLGWLEVLGKWSMLDVFVVAILIVLVKLGPLVKIEPRDGVYFFCAAIIASMLTTMYVNRVAHAHLDRRP